MKILLLASLIIVMLFVGCYDCDGEMKDVRNTYGAPEETSTYSSDGYNSTSWWFWSKGVEYTFIEYNGEECEVSKYTFTPINKAVSSEMKIKIDETKVLEYTRSKCENIIF